MVAIAAALYAPAGTEVTSDDLANGFARASLALTIISAAGIALALLAAGTGRRSRGRATAPPRPPRPPRTPSRTRSHLASTADR